MYNSILARRKIASFKREGKNKIVILPYGEYGRWFETRMEYFRIKPIYCIDNHVYDGIHVFKADDCRYEDESITYLIATEKKEVYSYLKADLINRGVQEEKIESAQDGFEDVHRLMTCKDKINLDFLCVGVAKCGTTSLNAALKKNPHIFLPKVKDTHFLIYLSEDRHEFTKQTYEPRKKGGYSRIGGVAPSYFSEPELVYHYFGKDTKIIICLRDPIKRLFSEIKFNTCFPYDETLTLSLYEKYNTFSPEMVDEWAHKMAFFNMYHEPIKYWLEYFPPNQIQFIVFEELISQPREIMDGIQNFIGIEHSNKIQYDSLPKSNSNNKVAKDYRCACINSIIHSAMLEETNGKNRETLWKLLHKTLEYTTCECDTVISESTRKWLMEIFSEDIRETEKLIGRSLPYIQNWNTFL